MRGTAQSTIASAFPVSDRSWSDWAVAQLLEGERANIETPLKVLVHPDLPDCRFLLKDESVHASGSLKHRLARSLFLYALCNGRLSQDQSVIDASSGSTAISEAWFAQQLGLKFIAVMPECTASAKRARVESLGGHCELLPVDADITEYAARLAGQTGACYLDQFGLACSATDWRGNNNIAESMLTQSLAMTGSEPDWIVCGAGTGGTSATIGRYLRYCGSKSRLCVAEPTGRAFARGWQTHDYAAVATQPSVIEGIGRARVEPGFVFDVVDAMEEVSDRDSIAGCLELH